MEGKYNYVIQEGGEADWSHRASLLGLHDGAAATVGLLFARLLGLF